jgi:hypothetical protein
MAILVERFKLVVRLEAIEVEHPGGWVVEPRRVERGGGGRECEVIQRWVML